MLVILQPCSTTRWNLPFLLREAEVILWVFVWSQNLVPTMDTVNSSVSEHGLRFAGRAFSVEHSIAGHRATDRHHKRAFWDMQSTYSPCLNILREKLHSCGILTSDFSSLFCESTCVMISFMLVSRTMPPITISDRILCTWEHLNKSNAKNL